jgi:ubiquinone/menaquinone biosynthesis C-methylase UbiE
VQEDQRWRHQTSIMTVTDTYHRDDNLLAVRRFNRVRPRPSPRWNLTEEELERVHAGKPFGPLEVAMLLGRSPRVLGETVRAMVSGAVEGAATNGSLVWVLERERLRRAVPDAAGGANWGPEEWFWQSLMPRLGEQMHVLDLGCGAGRIARLVAPLVARVTGADVSEVLLAEARENFADVPNVDFVRTSRYSLSPLEDASFDLVFSAGVLSYLDPIAVIAILDEVGRVLKPGGLSVINFRTIDLPAGREYALQTARAAERTERVGGSAAKPYLNAQVKAMHSLVGLEIVEMVQPAKIGDGQSTIFIAARNTDRP